MSTSAYTVEEIIARLVPLAGAKSDSEIAKELGVTPQVLSNWKGRASIPYSTLCDYANRRGLALDYVFFGIGPKYRRRTEIDVSLLSSIGAAMEFLAPRRWKELPNNQKYYYIALTYNRLLRLPDDERHRAVNDEVNFLLTALRTADDEITDVEHLMEQPARLKDIAEDLREDEHERRKKKRSRLT